jgi:NADH-quinone oxidoreductase subunit F
MSHQSIDLSKLEAVLAAHAPHGRTRLLPALQDAQALYGYLPEPVVTAVSTALRVPLADVHGVIGFYTMLYREPVGRTVLRVCTDLSCAANGGEETLQAACARAGLASPGTSADGELTVERSPCLGCCNVAPAVNVTFNAPAPARCVTFTRVHSGALEAVLAGNGAESGTRAADDYVGGDMCIVTALCGRGRRHSLTEYEAVGGMRSLREVLGNAWPNARVVQVLKDSGLIGRGGAAFPTWIKWEGTGKAQSTERYFVVNADESEPGTFKDRVLLEGDPCRPIEGAIIGAYAIGARKAYIYVRGEYPTAIARLQTSLDECRAAGYLGTNILGSGFDLDIELRAGAGAYICGEETALLESIEGKRGLPRVKPPFPNTYGLFGKPTVIQNVETLAKVPYIITHGADAFKRFGTEKSAGTKLVCLSGNVARPGVYEIPFGVTLRHLIDNLGGGVIGGALQAVLVGGAAGAFTTEKDLDVRLTFEDLRAAGLTLGSGAVMVFNDKRDMRDLLARLGRFFAHESCGKCYPCQLGTLRQSEILGRVAAGGPRPGDAATLSDVGWTMTDASLCGLGQTAATAVRSAMALWPELFVAQNADKAHD